MPTYRLFGGLLDSSVEFQGLEPVDVGLPTWTFRVDGSATRPELGALVGREQVSSELAITLWRTREGGFLLNYSAYGLGDFVISPDGARITWVPRPDAWVEALRWVLLGRVMAAAMYLGGVLCLHGSAVALHHQGVCFLAPKYHGKSTLAAALVASGARLAADDVLPVDVGPPVRMRPGVPVLRLNADSRGAVDRSGPLPGGSTEDLGKARIDFSGAEDLVPGPHPLSAIYVLAPTREEPEPGRAAVRERLQGRAALETIVRHSSIAPLVSAAEAGPLLTQASAIARSVPVYVLRSVRDFSRLPETVAALRGWHGGLSPVPTALTA